MLPEPIFREHNVNAEVEFSWGATEVKVPELVDAIVDLNGDGQFPSGEQTSNC
jgi:ATP phosphoribosyltransferase